MKKKLSLLALALLLVGGVLTGCAKKPEVVFSEQINSEINAVAEKVGSTYGMVVDGASKSYGYDTKVDLDLNSEVAGTELFTGSSVDIGIDYDGKNTKCLIDTEIQGEDFVKIEAVGNKENMYITLPEYTDKYLEVDTDNGETIKMPKLPDSKEIKDMIKDYGTTISSAFKYKECDTKASIEVEDIEFKGTRYTGECKVEDLKDAMEDVEDKFKDSDLYKELNDEIEQVTEKADSSISNEITDEAKSSITGKADDDDTVKLNIYLGKKGYKAYEIEGEDGQKVGFITDGKSWSVYKVEEKEVTEVAYNKIEIGGKDISGEIFVGDEESSIKIKYDDVTLKGKEVASCDVKLSVTTKGVSVDVAKGEYEVDGDTKTIKLNISVADKDLGKIKITSTKRKAEEVKVPDDAFKADEADKWQETLDMEKFNRDMQVIASLFTLKNSGKDPNAVDPNRSTNTTNTVGEDVNTGAETGGHDFTKYTGYKEDDGYVYFEPTEDEVLAKGEPSTGIKVLDLSDSQLAKIEEYIANCDIAKGNTAQESTYYSISGSVGRVESYYTREITYGKDYDNYVTLTYEAITGKLNKVSIRCTDEAKVFEITQRVADIVIPEASDKLENVYEDGYAAVTNSDYTVNAYIMQSDDSDGSKYYNGSVY